MLKNEQICREAEELVIGSIVFESNSILRINELLKGKMFFTKVNAEIFECVQVMSDKNERIDMITVADALKNSQVFEAAGGIMYLSRLSGLIASTLHLEAWAKIVHNSFVHRMVMMMSAKFQEKASLNASSADDILNEIRKDLDRIDCDLPLFNSISDMSTLVNRSRNLLAERVDNYKNGVEITGISSGLKDLDEMLGGWQNGDLIVLAARPSIGKTSLAIKFAEHAAIIGKKSLIFSMEMSAHKISDRLILGHSNVDARKWRNGNLTLDELYDVQNSCESISNLPIFVDDTSFLSIGQIKSAAKRMQMRGLCDLLFIDYLQLANMNSENRHSNRNDLVAAASSEAKIIAKELNIPVILLSQLNRSVESRPSKTPELADLRESGSIEQDADEVILIHRPEFYGHTEDLKGRSTKGRGELIIAKHRNGPTGTVYFKYNTSVTKIEDYTITN